METKISSSEMLDLIPSINPQKNYWLVRTSSGANYDDFINGGYIAIGWNEITLFDLNQINLFPGNRPLFDTIRDKVKSERDDDDSENSRGIQAYQSRSIGQLLKFAYEIKKGDVVVIPSYNSDKLAFGEVLTTPILTSDSIKFGSDQCEYNKRKRVRWLKTNVSRSTLDSNLYKFIFAHQTINNISEYSEHINNFLYDFYQVDGNYSLVLRVKSTAKIDAFAMSQFYSDLIYFINYFSDVEEEKDKKLSVTFDLQSPGTIVFVGSILLGVGLFTIAMFTIMAGGENGFEFDPESKKIKWNFKSNSFLEKYSEYLDRKEARNERKAKRITEEDEQRRKRLFENLKHFEVSPNKDVSELTEPGSEEKN
jgi:hypothetical protein